MIVLMALGFLLGNLFKSSYMKTFNNQIQKETNLFHTIFKFVVELVLFLKNNKTEKLKPLMDSNVTILSDEGEYFISIQMSSRKLNQVVITKYFEKSHWKRD